MNQYRIIRRRRKMFNKKRIAVLLGITLAISLTAVGCGSKPSTATADAPIIVKFSHVTTAETPKGKAANKFKELLEQKTDGRMKVEVYPSSQLYGDKEELEQAQAGNVQIIAPSITKLVGLNPKVQYVDLPFLFPNNEAVYKFWASDANKDLMNSFDKFSLKGLAMWPNGFKQFSNNRNPLLTPENFKGLKFRTQAGKVLEAQFKALGAGSATIPFGETYAALQQGTVDGQENTYNNIDTQKYEEVQKYLSVTNHGRIDYIVLINDTFFNGLAPDLQKALLESMDEATKFEITQAELLDKESLDNLKKGGKMQITELSPAQLGNFQKLMDPIYTEFESVISKDIIDAAKNASK